MQNCAVVHVAAAPSLCPNAALSVAPHLVHFCANVHVAAAPSLCPNLGRIVLPVSLPHLEHFVYFECPAVVQVAAFSG